MLSGSVLWPALEAYRSASVEVPVWLHSAYQSPGTCGSRTPLYIYVHICVSYMYDYKDLHIHTYLYACIYIYTYVQIVAFEVKQDCSSSTVSLTLLHRPLAEDNVAMRSRKSAGFERSERIMYVIF